RHEVEADPDTDRRHIGLIAEEVDQLGLTALVTYDGDGAPQAVDYGRLPVALIEVCRWQQQQIDHLTRRVADLEQAAGAPSPPALPEPTATPALPKRGPAPVPISTDRSRPRRT